MPAGRTNPACAGYRDNCWMNGMATSSVLYRCVPIYNMTQATNSSCLYPPPEYGVTLSASSPDCIISREATSGIVDKPAQANILFDKLNSARQTWGRWFGDLNRAWWVILVCAGGVGVLMGLTWLMLAKTFAPVFVWGTILLMLAVLAALDAYLYDKAGLIDVAMPASIAERLASTTAAIQSTASNSIAGQVVTQKLSDSGTTTSATGAYKALAIILTVVIFILVCTIVASRASIKRAVSVIKVGADAVRHNLTLVVFPLITTLGMLAYLLWWIFVAAALNTAGTLTVRDLKAEASTGIATLSAELQSAMPSITQLAETTGVNFTALGSSNMTLNAYNDMPAMHYLEIYHFFALLWTTQFIQGMAALTIAGVIGGWYFSLNENSNPEVEPLRYKPGPSPLLASLWRAFRYHMGSAAFGSLLIALIQFVRAVFAYIHKQMAAKNPSNSIKMIGMCIQCCLKCIQSCVELITRNAYIFIAVKGHSFFQASRKVFGLISSNAATLATVNIICEIIMFFGKVLIAAVAGWVAYAILERSSQFQPGGANEITSTWLVVLMTVFFGYAVASSFMSVFDLAVDTILVCYVTDMEENCSRHGGDESFKVPSHIKSSKMSYGGGSSKSGDVAMVNPAKKSKVAPN